MNALATMPTTPAGGEEEERDLTVVVPVHDEHVEFEAILEHVAVGSEVVLTIAGKAEIASSVMFSFELEFGGVFRIRNVPQESLNAVVLIESPRLLFPFAREIIATAVRNGGFPPLLLDPVDFVALYRQKMAQMPAAQAPAQ